MIEEKEEEERYCSTVPVSNIHRILQPLFSSHSSFFLSSQPKKKTSTQRFVPPILTPISSQTAGRDRTGVLTALLLALCRTPRALIAHDYLLTRIGIEPHRAFLFANFFGTSANPEAIDAGEKKTDKARGFRELCEVRESSILSFLDWMDEEWGGGRSSSSARCESGVRGWLIDEKGFEDGDLDRIVERLRLGVRGGKGGMRR